jgi:hypothetical protein
VAGVVLLFLAGTAAITWPWPAHFGTHIFGYPGDNYEFLWKLAWVPHRLHLHRTPFFASAVFPQAGGYDLGSTDLSPSATFLLAPVTALADPVVSYNLVMLASFVLAGVGAYLLCRRLGAAPLAALVGGAAFAFCPFHFVQNYGHLNVAQIGYTPFVFLAADSLATRRRVRDGIWFGLAMALAGLTTWYRLVFLLLTVPVFLFIRARQSGVRPGSLRQLAGPLALGTVVGAVLMLPFLVPAASFAAKGSEPSFGEAAFYSVSIGDYLIPPPGHPVTSYGTAGVLASDNHERIVYPGLIVAALALGCVAAPSLRRTGLAMAAVAAVAAVLSFGPVLRWSGRPVVVDAGRRAPGALHAVALEADARAGPTRMALPLPVYPLARYAPGLRGLRVWARAAEITALALAVMAALTLTSLLGRLPTPERTGRVGGVRRAGHKGWVGRVLSSGAAAEALVALALVLADAHMSPNPLVRPQPRPVDAWLAAQPGGVRIVQLPWEAGVSGTQLYYSSFNDKGVVLAQASVLPPAVAGASAALHAFPQGDAWPRVLRSWQVRYVLVDSSAVGSAAAMGDLPAAMARAGLRAVTRQGTVDVYEVPPAPRYP